MNLYKIQSPKKSSLWIALAIVAVVTIGALAWGMYPAQHTATGSSQRDFTLDIDFDKFRQIMVRKNATEAIVAHSGMKLLSEKVDEVSIDLPKQKHPLLNAILGKANANMSASKQITVSLKDPAVNATQLTLTQHADIQPDFMDVSSEANGPAGNLKAYTTRLRGSKSNEGTKVELTIDQSVDVKVPKFFISEADRKVQQAADKSTAEQETAIRAFIAKYQDDAIVLPQLR